MSEIREHEAKRRVPERQHVFKPDADTADADGGDLGRTGVVRERGCGATEDA